MSETTFRAQQEAPQEVLPSKVKPESISVSKVEVPFTSYRSENGGSYVSEHYEIGEMLKNSFAGEVGMIDSFLNNEVLEGRMENSVEAVKKKLKEIEKVTNMDKETRRVIKLEVLANYVKFLMKTDDIKKNITRYGSN